MDEENREEDFESFEDSEIDEDIADKYSAEDTRNLEKNKIDKSRMHKFFKRLEIISSLKILIFKWLSFAD